MPQNKDGGENALFQHYQICCEGCVYKAPLQEGQLSGIVPSLWMFEVLLIREEWIARLLC